MKRLFISLLVTIAIIIISCQNKSARLENYILGDISYLVDKQAFKSIFDTLKNYDTTATKGYSFYRIVIQQREYQDIILKITKILPSFWNIKSTFPSSFFEIDSTICFIYSGLEQLIRPDSIFVASIYDKYQNKGLINDILPNGHRNAEIFIPEYCTWEISLTDGKLCNLKKVADPFRPRLLKQDVFFRDTL